MEEDNKDMPKEPIDQEPKIIQEALQEMEKSFGLGTNKKSRIVSRGFSLNEIVEDSK